MGHAFPVVVSCMLHMALVNLTFAKVGPTTSCWCGMFIAGFCAALLSAPYLRLYISNHFNPEGM